MPKSAGASLHPCLTLLFYSRDWVSSPSTISLACTSVYSFLMILINFGGQPSLRRMMKRSSRLTVSNALTKSTKATIVVAMWSSWCQCFERRCCHVFFKLSFSWNIVLMILSWNLYVQSVCTSIYVAMKIQSMVLLPLRYPDCDWGYMDSTNRCCLCKMMSANTFPTALSSDMPL